MKVLKIFSLFIIASALLFTSCSRDEEIDIIEPETEIDVNVDTNPLVSRSVGSDEGLELECLTILFPFSVVDMDGVSIEIEDIDDISVLESEDNLIVDFVYPLDVEISDETIQIDDSFALGEAFVECVPDFTEYDFETDFPAYSISSETSCYNIDFPIALRNLDDETITVEDQEEFNNLLASDVHFFVYPFSLIDEDGGTVTVNDSDELFETLISCNDFVWTDSLDIDWGENSFEYVGCYLIEFPFDIVLQDGTVTTINNHEEYCELMFQGDIGNFVFPITLTSEDGDTFTVNSEDELFDLLDDCDTWVGSDTEEDFVSIFLLVAGSVGYDNVDACYSITYPIEYTDIDGMTQNLESQDESLEFINGPEFFNFSGLVYPVNIVITESGEEQVLESFEDIFALLEVCE
jgi:hypothetical protein